MKPDPESTRLSLSRPGEDILLVRLAGPWRLGGDLPAAAEVRDALAGSAVRHLAFDATGLTGWDSGLLTFLLEVLETAEARSVEVDREGLPAGARRLLRLATAVPEAGSRRGAEKVAWLARLGGTVTDAARAVPDTLSFLGEVTIAFGRWLRGKARFRRSDFWWTLQQTGPQAVPITGLLSFLVGMIMAYVGALQLRRFGAQIYVADLVTLAVVREMGAMMTGIIMAGRTGAAFAAQLGTMQVNEEIDALRTLAISPMEFLVLPRMLALILMMPLLCLYADILGIVGGAVIGVLSMGLGMAEYFEESRRAMGPGDVMVGLVKSSVFGVMVAVTGCYHGIRSGRSSAAVGIATTSAVVSGIVLIILSDSMLTVIFDILGV